MSTLVVRCEFVQTKRPAAVIDPVALFKVPRIQWSAPSTPAIAAAAEKPATAAVCKLIWQADALATIQVPCSVIRGKSTTLQQTRIDAELFQLKRERYSRHARTDDTNGCLDNAAVFNLSCINKQSNSSQFVHRTLNFHAYREPLKVRHSGNILL